MQIVHNTEAIFDVAVSPFLSEVLIRHIANNTKFLWRYQELDEWIEIDGYDFHLLYEDKLGFSVYRVGEYQESVPFNLFIIF